MSRGKHAVIGRCSELSVTQLGSSGQLCSEGQSVFTVCDMTFAGSDA